MVQRVAAPRRTGESKHQCRSESFILACPILGRATVSSAHSKEIINPHWIRETAAEENVTAYYPILDRVSQGYFDAKDTEQELYKSFVDLLKTDGHITEPEALASFEFALSVRSAAPRIEAHYQLYRTSVEPSLRAEQPSDCEIWVSFGGKQYCSPKLEDAFGDIENERYK